MKIFETKEETKVIKEVIEIKCDKCGVVSKAGEHGEIPGMFPYIETMGIHWNYGSKYDTDYWEWDLCENCIDNLFGKIARKYENEVDPEYDGLI